MKLCEDIIIKIAKEVEEGLPIKYACDLQGVSVTCWQFWMAQGKSDDEAEIDSLQRQFFVSIKKAYAKFVRDCKCTIRKGENGWQGTAWWLERTNKDFQLSTDSNAYVENINISTRVKKKNG
jgi:hypothetical protein